MFFFKDFAAHHTELRGSRFAPRFAPFVLARCSATSSPLLRVLLKIEAEVEDERHAVGFARLCRMVVCGEFVFFLAHLFWPSSLGEGGYTALEALAVAV